MTQSFAICHAEPIMTNRNALPLQALSIVSCHEHTDLHTMFSLMAACKELREYHNATITDVTIDSKVQAVVRRYRPPGFPSLFGGVGAIDQAARTDDMYIAQCGVHSLINALPCAASPPPWVKHVQHALFTATRCNSAEVTKYLGRVLIERAQYEPHEVDELISSNLSLIRDMGWENPPLLRCVRTNQETPGPGTYGQRAAFPVCSQS